MLTGISRPVIQKNTDAQQQKIGSHLLLGIPFIPVLWVLNLWSWK
jgi:hypothetical protein